MSPETFWALSWTELFAAFEGFAAFHNPQPKPQGMSKKDLENMMEEYPD